MNKNICLSCGGKFPLGETIEGCCSVRCALEIGRLEECPYCRNTGYCEVISGAYVVDIVQCPEGCGKTDPWVDGITYDDMWECCVTVPGSSPELV